MKSIAECFQCSSHKMGGDNFDQTGGEERDII